MIYYMWMWLLAALHAYCCLYATCMPCLLCFATYLCLAPKCLHLAAADKRQKPTRDRQTDTHTHTHTHTRKCRAVYGRLLTAETGN